MAANGSKQPRATTTLPPRTLNVQKFAEARSTELETLHTIVANRTNNDFRSQRSKRRRTTGYDNRAAKNRYRKKQKLGVNDLSHEVDPQKSQKKMLPRHIRRRLELRTNPERGYSTSGDGTKRLRTHLWHAKRFAMTNLWGFHLPLGVQGKGRGSRALLKTYKNGVVIHDASYVSAVQLEGPEDVLLSTLSMVLEPSPSARSEDNLHSLLSGSVHGSAMLHHVGATFPREIAPVIYMWRPLGGQKIDLESEGHHTRRYCTPQGMETPASIRQLWIWLHASAFDEGYAALKLACQKQMNVTGVSINCVSLEGQLSKLEVMGSKAFQLLQKILHPVSRTAAWNEDHFSSSAIMSLIVSDPRALAENKGRLVPAERSTDQLGNVREDEGKEHASLAGVADKNAESYWSSLSELRENSKFSDRLDLWDAGRGIRPPVEENVMCMEKHQQKLDFFCIGNTIIEKPNGPDDDQFSKLCPIVLLNDDIQKGSLMRWSVILPSNWVKAFWVPFVSSGAHAIGLRERRWIACDIGMPHFPSDFPDCNSYTCFMATEAAAFDEKAKLRPSAMRASKIPIPPPWNSVRFSLDELSCRVRDAHTHSEELSAKNMVIDNSLTNSDCGNRNKAALRPCGVSFGMFVARTSYMLTEFLNSVGGEHLLLFPSMPERKNSIYMFMKDEGKLDGGPNRARSVVTYSQKLCFLRVLLHAYKEGVFEEGAVVCAPYVSDITSWISSEVAPL